MTHSDVEGIKYFQQLYQQNSDPWNVRENWYERRKRQLVLASLPQQRYLNVFEPGCGNGELTVELSKRCDRMLASDGAESAVELAVKRLAQEPRCNHVTITRQSLPHEWPKESRDVFDLIVISEIAYYLQPADFTKLVSNTLESLSSGGTLLMCHWRHPFKDRTLDTYQVHDTFSALIDLHHFAHYEETDFLLDVWNKKESTVEKSAEIL